MSRLLAALLSRLETSRRRVAPKPRRPGWRPRLEALEERNLPSSFDPSQMTHAYGLDRVAFEDASHTKVAGDGTGQTIGIVDAYDDPNAAGDLAYFDNYFGLADPPSFSKVNQTGGTTPPTANTGWAQEIALDIEWAHVMAPGAKILLVEASSNSYSDLLTAVQYAASHAGVVSMSWSGGEWSGETGYDSDFTHSNVTYFAATGDSGKPAGYPAYSPNVVAVGGTSLTLDSSGNYSSESGWSGSGGGISAYESQPTYQNGVVTQSTTQRCAPDIAMDADPNTGVWVYNSYGTSGTHWGVWGGTSLATPLTAGVSAVVDQGASYLLGRSSYSGGDYLNALYNLPQTDLNDVTTGNNGYAAGPGYDLVTGRGSPVADRFVSGMDAAPVYNPLTGELLVTGGAHDSSDTITLSQNSSGQLVVQVASGTVLPGSGAPSSQTFYYNPGQYSSVTVCTSDGSGSTTVNVQDTTAVTLNLGVHDDTTVNVGTDHNTVNLWETASGTSTTIDGSSTMTVNVGKGGSVQNVKGSVRLGGPKGDLTVKLDDSADGGSRSVTVGGSGVSGLAPGAITFGSGSVGTLTVLGGTGNDTWTVTGTPAATGVTLTAGSGTNTLVGPDVNSTWRITGSNAGKLTGTGLAPVTFTGMANLTGGSAADDVVFGDGAGVAGNIDGGSGTNTLDYLAYTTSVKVDLGAGTATGVGGSVANVQQLRGGQGNDSLTGNTGGGTTFFAGPGSDTITGQGSGNTLVGTNAAGTWSVTSQNSGTLTFGTSTTTFSGVQNLTGGTGNDDFVFADGAGVDGNIDGGGGSNTLDLSAYSTAVTVDLTQNAATGVGTTFANLQNFIGSSAGGNTLYGPNAATTWNVTSRNAGTLGGGIAFSGFQNLTGGSANDTFVLANGVGVDGNLDGGSGTNTLDESLYKTAVAIDLTALTATGVGGNIANLQKFVGGSAGGNSLNGPAADTTWDLSGSDAGTLTGGFSFTAFGTLTGGGGNNTFVFARGAAVDGALTGGGGTTTLDYSAYATSVIVDLQTGYATGVSGGVSGINNVQGANGGGSGLYNLLIGNGGNVLTGGTNRRNILVAGGGASTLVGGGQDDLLIGGTTSYDTEAGLVTWQKIAAYWAGSDSFSTRVTNLTTGNGVPLLDATVITGNGGGNTFTGSGEMALIYTDGSDTVTGFGSNSKTVTISP